MPVLTAWLVTDIASVSAAKACGDLSNFRVYVEVKNGRRHCSIEP